MAKKDKKDNNKRTKAKKQPLTKEEKAFNRRVARGIAMVAVSALVGAGVTYGVMSAGTNNDTTLVSMKGNTITLSDLFNATKANNSNSSVLQNMVLYNVLDAKYGDKVTSKEVDNQYQSTLSSLTTYASYYGTTASGYVEQQYGVTLDAFKKYFVRESLLATYALNQAAEAEATDSAMQEAYKTYMPDTKVQVIQLSDQDTANSVLASTKESGADFASIAKDKTTQSDKKYEYTVNSSSTDLPTDVLSKIKDLNAGETSDVITVTNTSNYSSTYYIVKVVSREDKDSNWKTYQSQLKQTIVNEKTSDTSFQRQVVADLLTEYNVKVRDNDFQNLLSAYTASTSGSSSTSSSSSSTSTSSSSSSTSSSSSSN